MNCYISCRLMFKIVFSKANFFDQECSLVFLFATLDEWRVCFDVVFILNLARLN